METYVLVQSAEILMKRMKLQDTVTKQVHMSYGISFCVEMSCTQQIRVDTNNRNSEVFCHAKRTVGVYLTNYTVSESTRAQSYYSQPEDIEVYNIDILPWRKAKNTTVGSLRVLL